MQEEGFTSFICPACHTEIEATLDMIGERTECPACAARLIVPKPEPVEEPVPESDGIVRHAQGDDAKSQQQAQKNRTIRIELDDL